MWKHVNSNKIIGTQIKIQAYIKHLNNLKKTKSRLKIDKPWKPSFSLSKNKNKYFKSSQKEIDKQNKSLLMRMINLQQDKKFFSFNQIPSHVPSNKRTFSIIKQRQRNTEQKNINKQNMKIFQKIERVSSAYGKSQYDSDWNQNKKYKRNIGRKQSVPDFYQLARQYNKQLFFTSKSRTLSRIMRPHTANAY